MNSEPPSEESTEHLARVTDTWSDLRLLVVGDVILDEYRSGDVQRVSPEAPVPVVRVDRASTALGGAANVARNLVSLGAQCELVGLIGRDPEGAAVSAALEEIGVGARGLVVSDSRPTSHKLRVVARGQQMLRMDREATSAFASDEQAAIRRGFQAAVERCDAVILEDYDKGLFAEGTGRFAIESARAEGRIVIADPKNDLVRFRGADLVKPNLLEATRLVGGTGQTFPERQQLLEKVQTALGGGEVVVTRGAEGMTGLDDSGRLFDVPTRARSVFDVQGAGDTSVAALALARVGGASLLEACLLANAAAAAAVIQVGTAAVDRSELRAQLRDTLAAYTERERAESASATPGSGGGRR